MSTLSDERIDEIAATTDYEEGKWHRVFARAVLLAEASASAEQAAHPDAGILEIRRLEGQALWLGPGPMVEREALEIAMSVAEGWQMQLDELDDEDDV